jgi:hypothetical protein
LQNYILNILRNITKLPVKIHKFQIIFAIHSFMNGRSRDK